MRLTKRDNGGNAVMACENCEIKYRESCCSLYLCRNALIKKLAAYEDTEEQGLLVRLPCKVGDSVFRYSHLEQRIQFLKCEGLLFDGISWKVRCTDFIPSWVGNQKRHFYIAASSFGKTVFLTREEAEAVLKGAEK